MESRLQKTREPLKEIITILSECYNGELDVAADEAISIAKSALAIPLRNCDVCKTGAEAKYRFLQIAELPEGNGDAEMREWYRKLIDWLFAPVTEKGGMK